MEASAGELKPKIRYTDTIVAPIVGASAVVVPVDHRGMLVTNTKPVVTSRVLKVFGAGIFETENSVYIPKEESDAG